MDGSGSIDYIEFVAAAGMMHREEHAVTIKRAFEQIDTDGSGAISVEEFARVCVNLGMGDYDDLLMTITVASQEELVRGGLRCMHILQSGKGTTLWRLEVWCLLRSALTLAWGTSSAALPADDSHHRMARGSGEGWFEVHAHASEWEGTSMKLVQVCVHHGMGHYLLMTATRTLQEENVSGIWRCPVYI